MIEVYVFESLKERNKNKKEGGKLIGKAKNPRELIRLANKNSGGYLNYFANDQAMDMDEALTALGATFDTITEFWSYRGKYL